MHDPTDRIAHTTAFITPVVEHWLEREIAQWVHPMMFVLVVSRLLLNLFYETSTCKCYTVFCLKQYSSNTINHETNMCVCINCLG